MAVEIDVHWHDEMGRQLAEEAVEKYHVVVDSDHANVRYVEAANGTGSRYVVVATMLPEGHHEGGRFLVTMMWPYVAAWTWTPYAHDDVYVSYVAEHFSRGPDYRWHPGDLMGVAMTIHRALGLDD